MKSKTYQVIEPTYQVTAQGFGGKGPAVTVEWVIIEPQATDFESAYKIAREGIKAGFVGVSIVRNEP